MQIESMAGKTPDIIGADENGVVKSPTLLALQRLPVPDEVRTSWSPAEEQRYQEMVTFRKAADKIIIPNLTPNTLVIAGARMVITAR